MPSAQTLKTVGPNYKPLYIPHQNMDVDNLMRDAPGRIILSMPSSATTQIKSAIRAAVRCKRKLVLVGQGIKKGVNRALTSYSPLIHERIVIPISEEYRLPYEEVVIMATGSQGERTSALAQIANGTHSDVQIIPDDTVLIITTFAPDKTSSVELMANKLNNLNAKVVIYHSLPKSPALPRDRKKRPKRLRYTKPVTPRLPIHTGMCYPGCRCSRRLEKTILPQVSKQGIKGKKKRASVTKKKKRQSSPTGPGKVMRKTYAELKDALETLSTQRTTGKNKSNRLSPEGPYGSWGLSIPREER